MPKQIKEPTVPWNHPGSKDVPVAKTSCESSVKLEEGTNELTRPEADQTSFFLFSSST